jgi:GTP-binding protein Era
VWNPRDAIREAAPRSRRRCRPSPRPQTTRHRILGILTNDTAQIVFVDTPGLHTSGKRAMNRHMNRAALTSLSDADVNLFVIEALRWLDDDQRVLDERRRR